MVQSAIGNSMHRSRENIGLISPIMPVNIGIDFSHNAYEGQKLGVRFGILGNLDVFLIKKMGNFFHMLFASST